MERVLHDGPHLRLAPLEPLVQCRGPSGMALSWPRFMAMRQSMSGSFRDDVPPGELASYCLYALAADSSLTSKAAVRRLVAVTLAGLRSPR